MVRHACSRWVDFPSLLLGTRVCSNIQEGIFFGSHWT